MYKSDDTLVLSASDLTGFLACGHLTELDRAVTLGNRTRPERAPGSVAAKYGNRHEEAHLRRLQEQGRTVATIALPGRGLAALHTAEQQTLAAMKEGADVIYQATFFDGEWVGHADFLIKDEGRPSTLGSWAYDVADTKLARHAKVSALVQMCSYGEHIARLQGVPPQTLTVITGDGTEETFPWSEHAPYFRAVRARMLASMASQQSTYPLPVAHCPLCRWEDHCDSRRRNEDHLSLVAGMRRGQIARLEAAGVGTVAELGAASGGQLNSVKAGAGTLARLQTQARLQIESRPLPIPAHQLLDAVQGQGLSLLPPSDPADVFFDMEGDPYLEGGGREYLFGLTEQANGSATFRAWWAHDRNEEKTAFEGFVDYVTELRDKHPGAHIYHYADYERAALVRLAGRHATREEQVNDLLREGALVDLYRVVRQGVLAGTESYSIKKLEPLYGFARGGAVTNAEDSIVEYERWLDEGRDPQVLDGIAAYNRLDCESTLALRDWLLTLRSGAPTPAAALPAVERSPLGDALIAFLDQVDIVGSQLTMGVPDDPASRSAAQQARWLLAHLLLWHRREDSAAWRDYFEHLRLGDQELIDDATCLGGMTYAGQVGQEKRAIHHGYTFPPQDCGLRIGDAPIDPATKSPAGALVSLDPVAGKLVLSRAKTSTKPHPAGLIPPTPPGTKEQRASLLRLATWVAGNGINSVDPAHRAARQLLLRAAPQLTRNAPVNDQPLLIDDEQPSSAVVRLAPLLDHALLPVQGPPGSGKTYAGARMIADLVARGQRVGVTGPSHKVITGLLDGLVEYTNQNSRTLRIMQKSDKEQACAHGSVTCTNDNGVIVSALKAKTVDVVAGTSWLLSRDDMAGQLDVLVIDEAGQTSLADTLAVSPSAQSMVLLGDPQQLGQPGAATHPDGVDVSALDHLLAGNATISPKLGVLLSDTWRMHPTICAWVSDTFYDSRLHPVPGLEPQRIDTSASDKNELLGAGLRWRPVEHEGRRNRSPEEAAEVARIVDELLEVTWTDQYGNNRKMTLQDILVVAPYNAHVAAIRAVVPPGVSVGTVDKFQGREAPAVIYSLASSTADDIPRGVEFLYSLNRLNVAVSRARALAIVVASPALLAPRLNRPSQARLVSAFDSLVEAATTPASQHHPETTGHGSGSTNADRNAPFRPSQGVQ